ncbi:MAG: hypothetical protein LBL07_09265, partial [Tannerella sp.]|nr:hypothetical protein [Tannerella sp.]
MLDKLYRYTCRDAMHRVSTMPVRKRLTERETLPPIPEPTVGEGRQASHTAHWGDSNSKCIPSREVLMSFPGVYNTRRLRMRDGTICFASSAPSLL